VLRPERMTRTVIVGPRDKLHHVIEALYDLKLVHIVDHRGEDDTFRIGKPLPPAAELSDNLVKLRSIASILSLKQAPKGKESVRLEELRQKILALELNITEEDAARKKAESLLLDLDRRIEELSPFAELRLPLEAYRGYESIAVLTGRLKPGISDLPLGAIPAEVFRAAAFAAVFVPKPMADEALSVLTRIGFAQLDVPAGEGNPSSLLDEAIADREKWRARLEDIQGRLATLRERYAAFVVAAEEALEIEVEKAEAPLRFAVSEHSFVIDGWVPSSRASELSARVGQHGLHVETVPTEPTHEETEPPVLLKNPKPAKPFEMLIHLYSTPSYHELDPTLFMLIAFPFFFGFMIGDAGYGALFLTIGSIAFAKLPRESDLRRLLLILALGGFWSLVFGMFVFGEAFGMPFHLPPGAPSEELAWSQFGLNFPIDEPLIHKTLNIGEMFYLSILFGALHLGTSYVMGFINEWSHSKKHAAAKIGWFLCLFGIFALLTRTLSWTRSGGWVWSVALSWFPRTLEPLGLGGLLGIGIPFASLLLIFAAFIGLVESPVAPLEIGGLLANVLSYLRLAGIGVGKATIAATFNALIFHSLILEHDIGIAIAGFALLTLAQLLVFLLGGVSAAIQGVRLNYVESFTKFYKGNGTLFRPFGVRATQEV
jgi:V/A-type H+-transporting ATPase subunit I